jgi:predicted enzyme related to lactoylglutathione lyase
MGSDRRPDLPAGAAVAAVMVHVGDVRAGLDWYERALAGALRKRSEDPQGFEFLDVRGVMLEIVPADEKVASGPAGSVVYWSVPSFEPALKRAIAAGAVLYRGPLSIEEGQRMCQLRDPWGNCIGLRGPA